MLSDDHVDSSVTPWTDTEHIVPLFELKKRVNDNVLASGTDFMRGQGWMWMSLRTVYNFLYFSAK